MKAYTFDIVLCTYAGNMPKLKSCSSRLYCSQSIAKSDLCLGEVVLNTLGPIAPPDTATNHPVKQAIFST